jgi:hypothetical protein
MPKRFALVLTVVALAGSADRTSGSEIGAEQALPALGPTLGGGQVLWAEDAGETMLVRLRSPGSRPRLVYRQHPTPRRQLQLWYPGEIAASRSVVAFRLSWSECEPWREEGRDGVHSWWTVRKGLPHQLRTQIEGACAEPDVALVGRARGPFRALSRKPRREASRVVSLDVDGETIAFVETFHRQSAARVRVVVRRFGRGDETVLQNVRAEADCCGKTRIAGRFVAWREGDAIIVHDLALGRTAYRVRLRNGSGSRGIDFDLQRDGKLVVAEAARSKLVWFGPDRPAARELSTRALFRGVRLDGGVVLFEHALGPRTSELVVSDLAGRRRRIAFFRQGERRWGDLDLAGDTVTWASRRDTRIYRECPSGGRPCRYVADGVLTIWTADIAGHRIPRHRLAEWVFRGLRPSG